MKLSIVEQPDAETELIVKCQNANAPEIQSLLQLLANREKRITVRTESSLTYLDPTEVLYCESVDSSVFVYTKDAIHPTPHTLSELVDIFRAAGFFRCSKSMVVNLRHIRSLQSEVSGRIIATLQNGERILISRHYAAALRQTLAT